MSVEITIDAKIALLRQGLAAQPDSPKVMLRLAEALIQKGDAQAAAEAFQRAYVQAPIPWLGRPGASLEELRDEAAALIGHGAAYSATIATLAVAEARLGHVQAVRRLVDYDRLFEDTMLKPPAGVALADFNTALAAEIRSNLTFYDEPKGRAIRRAWRDDDVMRSSRPACCAFAGAIRRAAEQYIARLPPSADHPFLASRPAEFEIEGWANLSDGAGHHESHIHGRAWASGVYYVVEPPIAREPGSRHGWLHVGPPEHRGVSRGQGWDERMIAPTPGRLILMPAYFYHDTEPMGVDQERICIAFDIVPAEIASAGSVGAEY